MTACLPARHVRLRITHPDKPTRYWTVICPETWDERRFTDYAAGAHEPYGETVEVLNWADTRDGNGDPLLFMVNTEGVTA